MPDALQQLGDMQISRRGFLRGLLTVGATAVVAPQILLRTEPEVLLPVGPLVEADPDYRKWLNGEGRIWQVRGPVRPRTRQEIIADFLKTPEGRQKLAASMVQPLRTRRDYSSIGRRTFLVEQLPDGALPTFDFPPIPLEQIQDRRFDLVSRAADLARSEIRAAEDERVYKVLDKIAKEGFQITEGAFVKDPTDPLAILRDPPVGIVLSNDSPGAWEKTAVKSGGWKAFARRFGFPV